MIAHFGINMGKFCLFKFRITSGKKLPQRFGGTEEVCYNFRDWWQQQAIVKFLSLNLSSPEWFITSWHLWEGRHNLGAKLAELIKPLTFPFIWPNVHDLFLLGMWRSSRFMSCELFVTADCSQGFHHASLIMTARQICCQPSSWPLPSKFVCFWKCCNPCSPVPFLCILRGYHIGHHQIECSIALWRNVVSLWDFIPSPKYPISFAQSTMSWSLSR